MFDLYSTVPALGRAENHRVAQGCARLAQGYAQGVHAYPFLLHIRPGCEALHDARLAQGWRKVGARLELYRLQVGLLKRASVLRSLNVDLWKTSCGARFRKVGARLCARAARLATQCKRTFENRDTGDGNNYAPLRRPRRSPTSEGPSSRNGLRFGLQS